MLTCVLTSPTIPTAMAAIEQASPLADLFELRLDCLEEDALTSIDQLIARSPLPFIFTFRRKEQGGAREISEERRFAILHKALTHAPAYCDLEIDTPSQRVAALIARFPLVKFIGSYHNFKRFPTDLPSFFDTMPQSHFAYYKLAVHVDSTSEMLRLLSFAKARPHLSCIALGECGAASRILGPLAGNAFNYTSLEEVGAPLFRPNLQMLHEAYRFSQLDRNTIPFALLGDPVEASPGHLFHNRAFREKQCNAVYVKLRVSLEDLAATLSAACLFGFKGFSITAPLKEAIVPLLDWVDPEARAIGAVNTVAVREGKTFGFNTDGVGALEAIEQQFSVKGKRVAILGAGGSARAIAYEAKKRGAFISVFNRSVQRAQDLGARLGVSVGDYEAFACSAWDLVINTIPRLEGGASPLPLPKIPSFLAAMDVIYQENYLSHLAKQRNVPFISGEAMFIKQAEMQQQIWDSSLRSCTKT